jgi:signal transduction histidine kinase
MIQSTKLEKRIFQYGLTLGWIYQSYQVINGLISDAPTTTINIIIGIFFLILFWLSIKLSNITWLAFSVHLIMLPVLGYFWSDFGGLAGTVPLVLYVYVSMIAGTLHGVLLISMFALYAVVFIFLTAFPHLAGLSLYDTSKVEPIQIAIDFFVITLIMTTFLIFLKKQLVSFRERITHRHHQLQNLAGMLEEQNVKLRLKQEETLSINENLESIVEERVKVIEEKNRQLEEYAFINAHLLRAPLCRILGILDLMEKEQSGEDLAKVKEKAIDIDHIIRRINETM